MLLLIDEWENLTLRVRERERERIRDEDEDDTAPRETQEWGRRWRRQDNTTKTSVMAQTSKNTLLSVSVDVLVRTSSGCETVSSLSLCRYSLSARRLVVVVVSVLQALLFSFGFALSLSSVRESELPLLWWVRATLSLSLYQSYPPWSYQNCTHYVLWNSFQTQNYQLNQMKNIRLIELIHKSMQSNVEHIATNRVVVIIWFKHNVMVCIMSMLIMSMLITNHLVLVRYKQNQCVCLHLIMCYPPPSPPPLNIFLSICMTNFI